MPGDKSITHRAVMLNAIASGAAMTGAGLGADCLSTARLHARVPGGHRAPALAGRGHRRRPAPPPAQRGERRAGPSCWWRGPAPADSRRPADVLDAGNSGTTARLLSGVLAGQPFFSVLNGDASLRSRPMGRVVQPLRQMGARIEARREGTLLPWPSLPRRCAGRAWSSASPAPSSSPASCWPGSTPGDDGDRAAGRRPRPHRAPAARPGGANHRGGQRDLTLAVEGGASLRAVDVAVPGDVSSAAFWLVAATIHPDARVTVRDVRSIPDAPACWTS